MYILSEQEIELLVSLAGESDMSGTSLEPSRTAAYGEDLRWRMVYQRECLRLGYSSIAHNLGVDESTVIRTVKLFNDTGSVTKRPYPSDKAFRLLTETCQLFILNLLLDRPGIYLREIQQELKDVLDLTITTSAICKFLHKSGFTRQKLRAVATQQDSLLREIFIADMTLHFAEAFVFLDETGADSYVSMVIYSIRGRPAVSRRLFHRGERVSAIACMSVNGILDIQTVRDTCDGETFHEFILTRLIHVLQP